MQMIWPPIPCSAAQTQALVWHARGLLEGCYDVRLLSDSPPTELSVSKIQGASLTVLLIQLSWSAAAARLSAASCASTSARRILNCLSCAASSARSCRRWCCSRSSTPRCICSSDSKHSTDPASSSSRHATTADCRSSCLAGSTSPGSPWHLLHCSAELLCTTDSRSS